MYLQTAVGQREYGIKEYCIKCILFGGSIFCLHIVLIITVVIVIIVLFSCRPKKSERPEDPRGPLGGRREERQGLEDSLYSTPAKQVGRRRRRRRRRRRIKRLSCTTRPPCRLMEEFGCTQYLTEQRREELAAGLSLTQVSHRTEN